MQLRTLPHIQLCRPIQYCQYAQKINNKFEIYIVTLLYKNI